MADWVIPEQARRLADVLRAEHNRVDLQEDPNRGIVVCAQREDGSLYELGSVSLVLVAQEPDAARAFIERLKFRRFGTGAAG